MSMTEKGEVRGSGLLVWGEPLSGAERTGILCVLGFSFLCLSPPPLLLSVTAATETPKSFSQGEAAAV